jgi:hypothetical protein
MPIFSDLPIGNVPFDLSPFRLSKFRCPNDPPTMDLSLVIETEIPSLRGPLFGAEENKV